MITGGIGNFVQSAGLRVPAQDNVSLDQQNTANQRAVENSTQPFEAELAESIQADNDSRQRFETIEDVSIQVSSDNSGNDTPRGSVVDVVV